MENSAASQQARPEKIRAMFDRIAPTYDLLNRLISFGLDNRWRRAAVSLLGRHRGGAFLDIAAGSGDVSLALRSLAPRFTAGADFSEPMLREYARKMDAGRVSGAFGQAVSDALRLPFRDGSFDGAVTAFGIRNFADRGRALSEMHRVLRPGGTVVILELTLPSNPVARALYRLHARIVLPLAGRIISGDSAAYRYLPDSIEEFPADGEFLGMMTAAGFREAAARRLAFGAAAIFSARRP